jgi:hypothetical protein
VNSGDAEVRKTTIEAIQRAVADMFGLSTEELNQKSKRRAVAVPRQVAMYLAKRLTDSSLPETGRYFGGMHHTTAMDAIAKMEEQRRTDSATDLAITRLLLCRGRSRSLPPSLGGSFRKSPSPACDVGSGSGADDHIGCFVHGTMGMDCELRLLFPVRSG